jgi:hypothetical protein
MVNQVDAKRMSTGVDWFVLLHLPWAHTVIALRIGPFRPQLH